MAYIIITAIGLLLILEGILPFLAPKLWRRMVSSMMGQNDRALHITGFIIMIIGVVLIVIAHHFLRI